MNSATLAQPPCPEVMHGCNLGTRSTRSTHAFAVLIAAAALLWVGGILSYAGNSLPGERAQTFYRYCGGQCLCDGGVANASLMASVCPEGWQEAYGLARRKLLQHRKNRRKSLRKRPKATPPPPPKPAGPNV